MGECVTRGVVLRSVCYRETSRILTLFSRDLGRITVSARGCMRPKSRERAATEMFTLGEYSLSERAGRYYLNAACIENAFYNLRLDVERLAYASYFIDICESVVNEEEPQPDFFDLLCACLSVLCGGQADVELVRLFYEARGMDILGFRPELDSCASCGGSLQEKTWFSVAAGVAVCQNCRAESPDAKPLLPGSLTFLRHVMEWDMDRMNVLKPADAVMGNLVTTWRPFVKWHLERNYKLDGFMEKLGSSNHFNGSWGC